MLKDSIKPIEVLKPTDIIISQLRDLIARGVLKPGDKLPPERQLAENFKVGRGYLREAIKKLEFYGILKTYPQRGTIVANRGASLLEHMISNIIQLEMKDKHSLMEVREILEINATRLTAERVNKEQLLSLKDTFDAQQQVIDAGAGGLNEDLVFHLKIAEFSGNTFINSMLMLIIPQVHNISTRANSCREGRAIEALQEHKAILDALSSGDKDKATDAMAYHLEKSRESFHI